MQRRYAPGEVEVFLDFGGDDPLFRLTNDPREAVEALEVNEISRAAFQKAVRGESVASADFLSKECSGERRGYDYGEVLESMDRDVADDADRLHAMQAFEALERLPPSAIYTNNEDYWGNQYGFVVVAEIISQATYQNDTALWMYEDWIQRTKMHSVLATTRMPFGKHKGLPLLDVSPSYIEWIVKKVELKGDATEAIHMMHVLNTGLHRAQFRNPRMNLDHEPLRILMQCEYDIMSRCTHLALDEVMGLPFDDEP